MSYSLCPFYNVCDREKPKEKYFSDDGCLFCRWASEDENGKCSGWYYDIKED